MSCFCKAALPLLLLILCFITEEAASSIIPVVKFCGPQLTEGAPAGWVLEKKAGSPSLKMEKEGGNYYLRFFSNGASSFGVRAASGGKF